jgi:hypothetical protein
MMGGMADSDGTRNEISGGLFFNAVVQAGTSARSPSGFR